MTASEAPSSEEAVAAAVASAYAAREPVLVEGRGTKRGMLRPVQAARTLSTRNLAGITLHSPQELIVAAQAGTTVAEIEAKVAEAGQHLIAEPPDFSGLLGEGKGRSGNLGRGRGREPVRTAPGGVGRDARPRHGRALRERRGRGAALGRARAQERDGPRSLQAALGQPRDARCPYRDHAQGAAGAGADRHARAGRAGCAAGRRGACRSASVAVRRLRCGLAARGSRGAGAGADGDARRCGADADRGLRAERDLSPRQAACELGGEVLDDAASRALWRRVRDAEVLSSAPEDAVWRVSVRPSAGPAVAAALDGSRMQVFLDWGGGLAWIAGPATAAMHGAVRGAAEAHGGTWTVMRAPESMRAAVDVVPPETMALARITRRVKGALDPAGILNPGRLYAGL